MTFAKGSLVVLQAVLLAQLVAQPADAAYVSPEEIKEGIRYASGDLYGLCDARGNAVIRPEFAQIELVRNGGVYLASSVDAQNKYLCGRDMFFLTAAGKRIALVAPPGAVLRGALWLGRAADENPEIQLSDLPPESLFTFERDHLRGICDVTGLEIVPAAYSQILKPTTNGDAMLVSPFDGRAERKSIFNVRTHELKRVSFRLRPEEYGEFSEGLCTFTRARKVGFMDRYGTEVIAPQFIGAEPFVNGLASATISCKENIDEWQHVLIDTKGNIVSPSNMDVQQFYGRLAVASVIGKSPTFGIVNRQFNWVVPPSYEQVYALPWMRSAFANYSYKYRQESIPEFFLAANKNKQTVISPEGKVLYSLPEDYEEFDRPPGGGWRCVNYRKVGNAQVADCLYLDEGGHELKRTTEPFPRPAPPLPPWGEKCFLKTVSTDSGNFDSWYWKSGRTEPISRLQMFSRFLTEYSLIGMRQNELFELLGAGDSSTDTLPEYLLEPVYAGSSGESTLRMRVVCSAGKVVGWSFLRFGRPADLVTTNVLIDPASKYWAGGREPRLVSKDSPLEQEPIMKPTR